MAILSVQNFRGDIETIVISQIKHGYFPHFEGWQTESESKPWPQLQITRISVSENGFIEQ